MPRLAQNGDKWVRVINATPRLHYPQERTQAPYKQEVGREKSLSPIETWTPDVRSVANHYTDWTICYKQT